MRERDTGIAEARQEPARSFKLRREVYTKSAGLAIAECAAVREDRKATSATRAQRATTNLRSATRPPARTRAK
jgi:hypothetical protein